LLWNLKYQFDERRFFRTRVDEAERTQNLAPIAKRIRDLANYGIGAIELGKQAEAAGLDSHRKLNGYPEFTPFTVGAVGTVPITLSGSHSVDVSRAKARMLWAPNDGLINWHHHEVLGLMQTVDRPAHSQSDFGRGHWGGRAIYRMVHGQGYEKKK
jgi:hypothetical protein